MNFDLIVTACPHRYHPGEVTGWEQDAVGESRTLCQEQRAGPGNGQDSIHRAWP